MKSYVSILGTIQSTIDRYKMFDKEDCLTVAVSGGKDSMFAIYALRELGYKVVPLVIDVGYPRVWGQKVCSNIRFYGFTPVIVNVLSTEFTSSLDFDSNCEFQERLALLNSIVKSDNLNLTACTPCFNIKYLAIKSFLQQNSSRVIVFGHHATDAIASFLKSVFMFIDRWDYNHHHYDSSIFNELIENSRGDFLNGYSKFVKTELFERLVELTKSQLAGTDEPPVQKTKNKAEFSYNIVRPLFNIFENEIIECIRQKEILFTPVSCWIKEERMLTQRQMVHNLILNALINNPDCGLIQEHLLNLVSDGITDNGTVKINIRKERDRILGSSYKPGEKLQ